jgi:uncharacterized protein (DUF427 family)
MNNYPPSITPLNHVAPVPRRIRAVLGGVTIVDTTRALYVWEWPKYPQYYLPLADVRSDVLMDERQREQTSRGVAYIHGLQAGGVLRPSGARVLTESPIDRLEWTAADSWFEEDEEVFVHPRDPYSRCDALRSTRRVRIELEGVVLAESSSPVMVFETGLPTRYYLNRREVNFERLVDSALVTACPYKGRTSRYWSVCIGDTHHRDLAWAYDFPTRQLSPVAGLVAFYNEKVDVILDGRPLERPQTHFSD